MDPGSQVLGAPGKTAHGTTRRLEPREEPPPDIAAGTRQQDGRPRSLRLSNRSELLLEALAGLPADREVLDLARGSGLDAETCSSSARASSRRSGWRSSSVSARRR